jgi:hypothetical protein
MDITIPFSNAGPQGGGRSQIVRGFARYSAKPKRRGKINGEGLQEENSGREKLTGRPESHASAAAPVIQHPAEIVFRRVFCCWGFKRRFMAPDPLPEPLQQTHLAPSLLLELENQQQSQLYNTRLKSPRKKSSWEIKKLQMPQSPHMISCCLVPALSI